MGLLHLSLRTLLQFGAMVVVGTAIGTAREPRRANDDTSSTPAANGQQAPDRPARGLGRAESRRGVSDASAGSRGTWRSAPRERQGESTTPAEGRRAASDRPRLIERFRQLPNDTEARGLAAEGTRRVPGGSPPEGNPLDRLRRRVLEGTGNAGTGSPAAEGSRRVPGSDAAEGSMLDWLRRRVLDGTGEKTTPGPRGDTDKQLPWPANGAGTRPSADQRDKPATRGGERPSLSDIRRRMRESSGALPGTGSEKKPPEPDMGDSRPQKHMPELNGPTQPTDANRSRQNRLSEMQGRILQDLDARPHASDGGPRKPGDQPPASKPGRPADKPPAAKPGKPGGMPPGPVGHAEVRFNDRYKAGQLHELTRGEMARNVRLEEQYRLRTQGDVGRRLALDRPPPGPGPMGPHYTNHCFKHPYYGPGPRPVPCWYPTWTGWVQWSCFYHCHPYWDPRPLYCRPVYYPPCPVWVYVRVPAWVTLPVVSCGTWVDAPVVTTPAPVDLQLLAVRFVDPGHPQENLGPRYRVWFRNNSRQPVAKPFNVLLLASGDAKLAADLPQAGVRVTSIDGSDTQSVDIRLPLSATTMARDALGNAEPYRFLHVLVDAQQETGDQWWENNGASLARGDILAVDPSTFDVQPSTAPAGSEVLLAGEGFGPGPGRVVLCVGGQEFDAEILGWYDLGVRVSLPAKAGTTGTVADLVVVRADGAAANPARITLTAP